MWSKSSPNQIRLRQHRPFSIIKKQCQYQILDSRSSTHDKIFKDSYLGTRTIAFAVREDRQADM